MRITLWYVSEFLVNVKGYASLYYDEKTNLMPRFVLFPFFILGFVLFFFFWGAGERGGGWVVLVIILFVSLAMFCFYIF